MHILVVNDDGPPSPTSSPYVHSLVRELQAHGHLVSVCLPHTQRSWIGKAHMIGQTVKPLYYRPPPPSAPAAGLADDDDNSNDNINPTTTNPAGATTQKYSGPRHGSTHARPSTRRGTEEWILVDGTPASCVQIGLYHFFRDRGPVDLVVSGPNYGRNTTAVFALSSGTLGGALEAAVCRHKAIALSYAFFTRNHDTGIIQKATRQSVRVIEALVRDWPSDGSVDLYSVNVPLLEGLEEGKVLFTPMLQNYWGPGSCFTEVDGSVDGEDEDEERIREEEGLAEEEEGEQAGVNRHLECHTHKHFKWTPKFTDVYKSVDEAAPGNDGWAVKEGHTSVTPLKANFFQTATHLHGTELRLCRTFGVEPQPAATAPASKEPEASQELAVRNKPQTPVYAVVDYADDYVQPLILSAMEKLLPAGSYTLVPPPPTWSASSSPDISLSELVPQQDGKVLQIMPYESIDFDYAADHPDTCLVNSYIIRKALIRKHFLSATVENWAAKHPESALAAHVKRSESFEVDYAEFLDDALIEAFDLRESLEKNEAALAEGKEGDVQWWILKPSMSDRGQGIRLFCTMEQLQEIFDGWEVESDEENDDEEQEDGENGTSKAREAEDEDYIMTSHLRHFVAQPYIHPPLLLPELGSRKFHIRTYVLCVGSMRVYVYRDMLALFAAKPYQPPSLSDAADGAETTDPNDNLDAHLTNTCLQTSLAAAAGSSSSSSSPNAETTAQPEGPKGGLVHRLSTLPLPANTHSSLLTQIYTITGDLFEAAARDG
ncbi:hypothetical protein VTJ49DRAFT_4489 [Mycothermus thermophilus]|uniref:Survival protein SurE-like phosphatase/nucleotidase domain-containing protein n=1 Tax=Humicola insolens TaxID=85995 RepID=A0ABR3V768_HUMIN